MKNINNMIDAIKAGEKGVIAYLKNNDVAQEEFEVLKKYQKIIKSQLIDDMVELYNKRILKDFISNPSATAMAMVSNDILLTAYKKLKEDKKDEIIEELISRHENGVLDTSKFYSFIKKNNGDRIFKHLSEETISDFALNLVFDLNNEKDFLNFLKFQNSDFIKLNLVSIYEFQFVQPYWDEFKDDIKKAFTKYIPDLALLVNSFFSEEKSKELISYYIDFHTSEKSSLDEKYKKSFKEKMLSFTSTFEMKEESIKLQNYDYTEMKATTHKM